jgi:hypothetical protein
MLFSYRMLRFTGFLGLCSFLLSVWIVTSLERAAVVVVKEKTEEVHPPNKILTKREKFLRVKLPIQLPADFTTYVDNVQFPEDDCAYGLKVKQNVDIVRIFYNDLVFLFVYLFY